MMFQKLKSLANKPTEEEAYLRGLYIVMKTFGYTIDEVRDIPLPVYFILLEMIKKENKEIEKRNRRKK